MNIVVFDVESWEQKAFEPLASEHALTFATEPLTEKNASEHGDAEAVSVFIYSAITPRVLDALPKLRLVASRSTGVDHIDVEACSARGVTVSNVPSYGADPVAEHVFALLLAISHRLIEAVDRTRRGDFSSRGLQGFDLRGKTFGVVGTGDIGTATIPIAKGFGMEVLAFDVKERPEAARALGFRYVDMDTLLRRSDIVTLHVPSRPETYHLIAEAEFAKMKDGAVLINTARGDVVDMTALARALAEGKIAAAGLDVLPNEPVIREEAELLRSVYEKKHDLATLLANEVLVHMRNVVVTPHSAFNTEQSGARILDTTIDNIRSFAKGLPKHAV